MIMMSAKTESEVRKLWVKVRWVRSQCSSLIEIPTALPLDTFFPEKLVAADSALERAQAIASEFGVVNTDTHVTQSREAGAAIVEMAQEGNYDLIVLGGKSQRGKSSFTVGRTVDYVIRNAPCRVWLCMN